MSCYTPYYVRDANNVVVKVPCGKCEPCVKRRVSGWSFRLMQEDRYSTSAHFITLTYDNAHIRITKNGFMGLDPTDLQLFIKRLRTNQERSYISIRERFPSIQSLGNKSIRYYAVGEYGGRTKRPHYHLIIFNAELKHIAPAWHDTKGMIGDIHYGTVSGASVGYTLKYMSKPQWRPMHSNDDREPQFSRMSKRLGMTYLTPKMIQWHHSDLENNMHLTLKDGRKVAMPRYYKDKIYNSEQRGMLKGYFEQQLQQKDLEDYQKQTGVYSQFYTEAVKASFDKMYYASSKITQSI